MIDQADRLYTAEQVRRLDRCAIEGHGIPGMDLMERAGHCAFEAAREAFPDARRYLVFCGGGNNGGDGYIVARLGIEEGLEVAVCSLKDPGSLHGDAATAADRWKRAGGSPLAWPLEEPASYDLVFDAMLGTGLDREPAGDYGEAVEWINRSGLPVVAVDIPSGLHADTGVALGRAEPTFAAIALLDGVLALVHLVFLRRAAGSLWTALATRRPLDPGSGGTL